MRGKLRDTDGKVRQVREIGAKQRLSRITGGLSGATELTLLTERGR